MGFFPILDPAPCCEQRYSFTVFKKLLPHSMLHCLSGKKSQLYWVLNIFWPLGVKIVHISDQSEYLRPLIRYLMWWPRPLTYDPNIIKCACIGLIPLPNNDFSLVIMDLHKTNRDSMMQRIQQNYITWDKVKQTHIQDQFRCICFEIKCANVGKDS